MVLEQKELYSAYIWKYNPFDEYKAVEYIQSDWNQYINTLFTPSNTSKAEWEMGGWSQSWSHQMFGTRYAWSSSWRWFAIVTDAYQFNANGSVSHWMTDWAKHTWELSQDWLYVDWTLKVTPATTTFTAPWPLYLFWLNNNWSFAESAAMKYYYFKIYDNWTLVRYFIPCYRKSDWVIWMRDTVEKKFYTNKWSWTFIKWPDTKREPWTNTLFYLPFSWNYNDYTWKTVTLTWTEMTYPTTTSWEQYSQWVSWTNLQCTTVSGFWWDCTVSCRINITSENVGRTIFTYWDGWYSWAWYWLTIKSSRRLYVYRRWGSWYPIDTGVDIPSETWTNIIVTHADRNTLIYINWVQASSNTFNYDLRWSTINIWSMVWSFDELILENRVWTADEISSYYSNTKVNYWIFDTLITSWTYSITESVNYDRYLGSQYINLPYEWIYRFVGYVTGWVEIEDYPAPRNSWGYISHDPQYWTTSFDKVIQLPSTLSLGIHLPSRSTWSINWEIYR